LLVFYAHQSHFQQPAITPVVVSVTLTILNIPIWCSRNISYYQLVSAAKKSIMVYTKIFSGFFDE